MWSDVFGSILLGRSLVSGTVDTGVVLLGLSLVGLGIHRFLSACEGLCSGCSGVGDLGHDVSFGMLWGSCLRGGGC